MTTRRYWMLVASLPHLPGPRSDTPLPIGRERLRSRLALLEAEDLLLIEQWGAWRDALDDAAPGDDATALAGWRRIESAARSKAVGTCLAEWSFERTLLAALRDRLAGRAIPERRWRAGPGGAHCLRHWNEPLFGLAAARPWLGEAEGLVKLGDAARLQELLDRREWRAAARLRAVDRFGFASVLGWWLQWRIAERQQRIREADIARRIRGWIEVAAGGGIAGAAL